MASPIGLEQNDGDQDDGATLGTQSRTLSIMSSNDNYAQISTSTTQLLNGIMRSLIALKTLVALGLTGIGTWRRGMSFSLVRKSMNAI
jgi:hypothetical protein